MIPPAPLTCTSNNPGEIHTSSPPSASYAPSSSILAIRPASIVTDTGVSVPTILPRRTMISPLYLLSCSRNIQPPVQTASQCCLRRACRNDLSKPVRDSASMRLNLTQPLNVPYFLALFLASPKKKGEKEGRRSDAAGLLFPRIAQRINTGVCALRTLKDFPRIGDGRISAEKPPLSPGGDMGNR